MNNLSDFIVIAIVTLIIFGYVNNIIRFVYCDFKEPYREEVVRGVGIFIPIIGIFTGYMNLEEIAEHDNQTDTSKT